MQPDPPGKTPLTLEWVFLDLKKKHGVFLPKWSKKRIFGTIFAPNTVKESLSRPYLFSDRLPKHRTFFTLGFVIFYNFTMLTNMCFRIKTVLHA